MSSIRLREDAGLPLFEPPERLTAPGHVAPDLAIACPATDRPFRLEAERISVEGSERGPATSIRIDGQRVIGRIQAGEGVVANVVLSPGRIRRERIGPGGSLQETMLAAPTLPWVALHWAPVGGALSVQVLPEARVERYRVNGGLATVADPGSNQVLALALSPASGPWAAEPHAQGGLVLRHGGAPSPLTLLIAYGPPETVRTAFRAAGHLTTHEVRAIGRPGHDPLTVSTGARELDDAVAWMTSRLRHGILHAEHGEPEGTDHARPWLWAGLGSVAIGDGDGALRCVRALQRAGDTEAAALLAARVALATGQVDALLGHADVLLAEAKAGADPALRRLARRTVADALRYAAPDDVLELLREGTERAPAPSGRRLPTIGHPVETDGTGSWLTSMLERKGTSAPAVTPAVGGRGPAEQALAEALRAWSDFASESSEAWAAWRMLVQQGITPGHHGGGSWDALLKPPAVTGALLAAMAYGWLGTSPDAPVGRLSLAPRLPEHLRSFRVRGIPIGDSRVALSYERTEGAHGFTVDIERGRVPPVLVFEATVPGQVGRVMLDGTPVDPHISQGSRGSTVRLQIPLDAPHTIELERG
ncbi:MAG: hypothetical protein WD995_03850 [Gemmatimonadota bacterium]